MKKQLNEYSKKYSMNTTKIRTIALSEKNHTKLRKLNIKFSRFFNDFLENKISIDIKKDQIHDYQNRVITSLSIDLNNVKRLDKISNLNQYVNDLISSM